MDLWLGHLIHLRDKDFAALEHDGSLARQEEMYDGVENRTLRDVHGEVNQAIIVCGVSLVPLWKNRWRAVGASGLVRAIGLDKVRLCVEVLVCSRVSGCVLNCAFLCVFYVCCLFLVYA